MVDGRADPYDTRPLKGTLAPLRWQDAGETLWLPLWREQTGKSAAELATLTPESIPGLAKDLPRLVAGLGLARTPSEVTNEGVGYALHLVGAALAILLREYGFTIHALPGQPVRLEHADLSLKPFEVMRELTTDKVSGDEWRAPCTSLGIAGVPLARAGDGVVPPAEASPVSGERPPRGAAGPTAR